MYFHSFGGLTGVHISDIFAFKLITLNNLEMKRTLSILVFAFICITITNKVTAQNVDVYTAGYEKNAAGISVGKVWKNSSLLYSLDAEKTVFIKSIFVANNDVYVAGYENTNAKRVAKVWKNGKALYSFAANDATYDAFATDIYVSGGDVYIAGYESKILGTSTYVVGWVRKNNGILYNLSSALSVSGMYVVNSDIYVCGSSEDGGKSKATVWKNGNRTIVDNVQQVAPGTSWSNASDVIVLGNTVYVAGYSLIGSRPAHIWRYVDSVERLYTFNGTTTVNPYAYAYSFDITGTSLSTATVYTVVTSATDKVYKNSSELYSFPNAKITDISVKKDDVYLSGYSLDSKARAKIWKNGEELFVLTDGMYDANADAFFVVERNGTGLEDIQANNISIYPNPVREELFIKSETNIDKIEIYDITGKQIFTGNLSKDKSINVSSLSAGIYLLKIGDFRGKIVKE
jgi:hypothetical protein